MVYAIGFARIFIMGAALIWFFASLLNLRSASLGQGSKFLPSSSQPTVMGSFLQMFVAGLTFLFAYNMTVAAAIGAIFNDNMGSIQLYSVGSYIENPTADQYRELLKRFTKNVFALVGFLAVWRGLSSWYQKLEGVGQAQTHQIVGWIVLGGLCFFPDFLSGMLASLLGFDVFGAIFGGSK